MMKFDFSTLLASLAVLLTALIPVTVHAQDDEDGAGAYLLVGGAMYNESFDDAVGGGAGYALAFGYQFNENFGIEFRGDFAAAVEPEDVAADIEQSVNIDLDYYDWEIKTYGNVYGSILATFTVEVADRVCVIGKVGVSNVEQEVEIEIGTERIAETESSTGGIVSGGIQFSMTESTALELSVQQTLHEDAESTSLQAGIKFRF